MTIIDVKTVFVIYVITNALCAVVMTSLWLQNRKRFPEIALWLIDFVLQFIAILLILLRGVVPDFVSMVLANTFVVGGTVVLYIGLERYVGKRSWQIHNYVMVGVFMCVHAYLVYTYPDLLALRNINLSLGLLYISVQAGWLMLHWVEPKMRPVTRATGIVFVIFCLVSLVRIAFNLMRLQVATDLFHSGLFDVSMLVIYQVLFIALTFALFILVNRKLSAELENELVEHQKTEGELREREGSISAITNSARDAITMMDNNGNISYWNPAAERILGYKKEEAIGLNLHELLTPERFFPAYLAAFPEFKKTGRGNAIGKTLELAARRKDGQEIDVALSLSAVKIKGEWHAVGIIQDITERKKAEEKVHHMATHDSLTDLPTLRLAEDRLSMAMGLASRHKEMVAVMFIDLDNFKTVNDTLGHNAGDYLLKQVAGRLLSCVRKTDTVARVGGDEFLLIATELHSSDDAAQMAEEIIRLVAQPVVIDGRSAVTSASIGIAFYPDHSGNIDQLIKLADEAMYRIKNGGKNGFGFANSER